MSVLLVSGAAFSASMELGYSRAATPGMIAWYESRFGKPSNGFLRDWKAFVQSLPARAPDRDLAAERELLSRVNAFFNRIPWVSDADHWNAEDYWATPAEMVSSHGGDCEDFSIGKFYALKELDVPVARLRLVYARAGRSGEAHMVLAYYPEANSDPLILDNLYGSIEPASRREDLVPVFSFNDEDLLFPQPGGQTLRLSPTSNRKWKDVIAKLERELTY